MTNNQIQDLSDDELFELSDDELEVRIDKCLADLNEVNDEVEKSNDTLEAEDTMEETDTSIADEAEDKKFKEEVEDDLDRSLNNAMLDLASDDDGFVEEE